MNDSGGSGEALRRIRLALATLLALLALGVVGYMAIEGFGLLDALYMTVITLSTVGFGEIHPLSPGGRVFTIALVLVGVGVGAYLAGNVARFLIEGEIRQVFGRKKLQQKIGVLRRHVVVCGYGRVGMRVAHDVRVAGVPVVVVERNEVRYQRALDDGFLAVHGNATEDEVLQEAHVEHARALVTVLSDDSDNVYICLTARQLQPDIFLLARANDERSELKMRRAGADRVVLPAVIGGRAMAQAIVRPVVTDFVDLATGTEGTPLRLEQLHVRHASLLVGQTLGEIRREETVRGVTILAVRRDDGALVPGTVPETRLRPGDVLIALGEVPDLEKLEAMCAQGS